MNWSPLAVDLHHVARYRLLVAEILRWHGDQLSVHLLSDDLVVEGLAVADARALGPGLVAPSPITFASVGRLHERAALAVSNLS